MILLFRIISDEDQDFFRDLVIGGSDTFLDMHTTLQKDLGYDASQLASFFITGEMWEKQQEITLIDMMQEPDQKALTMDEATLEEYITEVGQRLIYVFDFFSERAFFMELIERSDETSPRETPFVASARGNAPPQLTLDQLFEEPESEPDFADDDLDPGNYRLDDLDPDLFETGNPDDF